MHGRAHIEVYCFFIFSVAAIDIMMNNYDSAYLQYNKENDDASSNHAWVSLLGNNYN